MKNGNKVESMNNSKGSGATGWEGVAKQAGKFDAEAAKKAAQKDAPKKESEKEEVEFDLLSVGLLADHDGSKLRKLNNLRQAEIDYTVSAKVSTPSDIAGAKSFKEQADKLEQEIRDKGAAMLEAQAERRRKAAEEAAVESANEAVQEEEKKGFGGFLKKLFGKKEEAAEEPVEDLNETMQKEKNKPKSIRDQAIEYSAHLSDQSLSFAAKDESREIAKLKNQYETATPGSRLQEKLRKELARHGHSFGFNMDDFAYSALSEPDGRGYDNAKIKAMRLKASDWMTVKLTLQSKDARQTKKRFKKHGLPTKITDSFRDASITCHEMSEMANLCYNSFQKQE